MLRAARGGDAAEVEHRLVGPAEVGQHALDRGPGVRVVARQKTVRAETSEGSTMIGAASVLRLLTTSVVGSACWSCSPTPRAGVLQREPGGHGVGEVEQDLPGQDVRADGGDGVQRLRLGDGVDDEVRGGDRPGVARDGNGAWTSVGGRDRSVTQ